ncbi:MAG: hypothetical protein NZM04_10985 [Methylacidiphilales bacterium]|nr:hypothetical protein [Candidatus Methylacidiphilales bacterium]MDW8349941.1 hypothetical protein [Verrucomicrobiae bacterium]
MAFYLTPRQQAIILIFSLILIIGNIVYRLRSPSPAQKNSLKNVFTNPKIFI